MKVRELIKRLEELAEVSAQVPGRPEDEVLVVNADRHLCTIEEVYSDDSPFQHAGILVQLGSPFGLTWPEGKRVPMEGK